MKKTLKTLVLSIAFYGVINVSAYATLLSNARLDFISGVTTTVTTPIGDTVSSVHSGSYFGVDTNADNVISAEERIAISAHNGLILGTSQNATGSHSGLIDGTESPGIDNPWRYFGNTGMHKTTSDVTVLSALGDNAVLDFSGWGNTWNGINLNLGGGTATLTCTIFTDCESGSAYTLDYATTFDGGTPESKFLVLYEVHFEGIVHAPIPASFWLFGTGLLGLISLARVNNKK